MHALFKSAQSVVQARKSSFFGGVSRFFENVISVARRIVYFCQCTFCVEICCVDWFQLNAREDGTLVSLVVFTHLNQMCRRQVF